MLYYITLDEDGYIRGCGSSDQLPPNSQVVPAEVPSHVVWPNKHKLVDGVYVDCGLSWMPEPSFEMRRARAYPDVGDQLDALWKSLGPLMEHPEAVAMFEKIMEVKEAITRASN